MKFYQTAIVCLLAADVLVKSLYISLKVPLFIPLGWPLHDFIESSWSKQTFPCQEQFWSAGDRSAEIHRLGGSYRALQKAPDFQAGFRKVVSHQAFCMPLVARQLMAELLVHLVQSIHRHNQNFGLCSLPIFVAVVIDAFPFMLEDIL